MVICLYAACRSYTDYLNNTASGLDAFGKPKREREKKRSYLPSENVRDVTRKTKRIRQKKKKPWPELLL